MLWKVVQRSYAKVLKQHSSNSWFCIWYCQERLISPKWGVALTTRNNASCSCLNVSLTGCSSTSALCGDSLEKCQKKHCHRRKLHFKVGQEDSLYRQVLVGMRFRNETRIGNSRYRCYRHWQSGLYDAACGTDIRQGISGKARRRLQSYGLVSWRTPQIQGQAARHNTSCRCRCLVLKGKVRQWSLPVGIPCHQPPAWWCRLVVFTWRCPHRQAGTTAHQRSKDWFWQTRHPALWSSRHWRRKGLLSQDLFKGNETQHQGRGSLSGIRRR